MNKHTNYEDSLIFYQEISLSHAVSLNEMNVSNA